MLSMRVAVREPKVILKVNFTTSFNQLLRDGHMTTYVRHENRRVPIIAQKIQVAVCVNQQLRECRMPCIAYYVDQRASILHLKIDVTSSDQGLCS
jgi:hypothetical protein